MKKSIWLALILATSVIGCTKQAEETKADETAEIETVPMSAEPAEPTVTAGDVTEEPQADDVAETEEVQAEDGALDEEIIESVNDDTQPQK